MEKIAYRNGEQALTGKHQFTVTPAGVSLHKAVIIDRTYASVIESKRFSSNDEAWSWIDGRNRELTAA